ncbi:hypothetical protein HPB50_018789 [Hyalomma asiaticum]|uniref:Uncharacterized protein n=1 Tax=Hyalomma asiaticum TaxID=266040 RepID=A0ACB7RQI7_HYAAI|nr:hypothetical protein HPB50_018789 [Hyalomma asiaticum]
MRPRQLLIAVVLLTTLYLFWCELNYNLTFSSWNIATHTTLQNEAADHHLPAEQVKSKNAPTYINIPIRPNQPASRPKRVTEAIPEFSSASTTAELSNSTERATTDTVTIGKNTTVTYLTKHPAKEVEADSWTSMPTTSRRVNTTSKSATSRRRANDSIYKKLFTAQKATLLKRFAAAYPQENPRKVRRILEVAYFRSGSSFLGQLLSANPQTFYHFEPLRTLSQGSRLYGEAALRGLGYVTDFFSCDFANHSGHLRLAMKFSHPFRQNSYLWSVCEGVKPVCVDPEFLKTVCKTAPTQTVKGSGRQCVNAWGAITKDGLGPLYRIVGHLCSEDYMTIIDHQLLPHVLDGPYSDGHFLLQQDLSPIHTARSVTKHLENLGVMTLDWPPKGADMNVIENVWGILKHNLSKMGLHTATPDELWQAIKSEWEKLKADSDLVPALYDSLPRRMSAVVELCGDFTHY